MRIKATVYHLGQGEHVLLINQHHIISDGWSIGVLVKELFELYNAFQAGLPSPFSDLEIQYVDFAVWQRDWLQGDVLNQQLRYWKTQLANVPTLLDLPTDYPRPTQQEFEGDTISFTLASELVSHLKMVSQTEGVTLFMTLYSSFAILLARYKREGQLFVGLSYKTSLFSRKTMERMAGHFETLLSGIVSDPEQPVSRIPMLKEVERKQILLDWNNTQADYPTRCIQHLFEEQVEQTPNNIAVVFINP